MHLLWIKRAKLTYLLLLSIEIVTDDVWHGLLFIILWELRIVLRTKSVSLTLLANVNTNLTNNIIYTILNNLTVQVIHNRIIIIYI